MSQPKLIGLLGKARSGKDTSADYLIKHHKYTKTSFANPLKNACTAVFGFTDEQLYGDLKETVDKRWGISPRQAMQFVGTDLFRKQFGQIAPHIGEDVWIRSFMINYNNNNNIHNNNTIIADVRFQNEIDAVKELGGIVIKITRDDAEKMTKHGDHESEFNQDSLTGYDLEIKNNGTLDDLYKQLEKVVN